MTLNRSASDASERALPWLLLVTVRGPSMVPALRPGDRLLAKRMRVGSRLRLGSVVVVEWPARPGMRGVKRVVRPMRDGHWVEGDNAYGSDDSRTYGVASVRAVVLLRLWPWPPRKPATLRR